MGLHISKNVYRAICHGALAVVSVMTIIRASQFSVGFNLGLLGLIVWAILPYILFGAFALMMDFLLPSSATMPSLALSALILAGAGMVLLFVGVGFLGGVDGTSDLRRSTGWQLVGGFVLAGLCSGIIITKQMKEDV